MTEKRKGICLYALLLAAVTAASVAIFLFCYRHDNKYTHPRPVANMGVIRLDTEWYRNNPVFYLADGWAFYQGELLMPEEIPDHTPDAYFYIGRYGGFDLGDPEAAPHGRGTYRTVILTDGTEREYALELTPIYSKWRIWINGKLVQSEGLGEAGPRPPVDLVTFTAGERIEIVVAAEDSSHFYSGMVYPPAFGVPRMVSRISSARLLIHGAACGVALFIGIVCILVGAGCGFTRPYGALTLLCLSFCASTAWPLFQIWGQGQAWLYSVERLGYYGIFVSLIWIQGRMCNLPKKYYYPACAVGLTICLSVMTLEYLPFAKAAQMYAYSDILSVYKWFTAAWLLIVSGWALYQGIFYSGTMLAGNCIFAVALMMDKCLPLYEPVFTGWFVELAGGIIIFLAAGIVWYDLFRYYKESMTLRMEQQLTRAQLEARSRYETLQKDYVKETRRLLHETKNRLALIRYYLDGGELDKLKEYLYRLTDAPGGEGVPDYTGHSLVDAILSIYRSSVSQKGIYMEVDGDRLPERLELSDDDLTSLFMNLLDNAVEACERLAPDDERWISVQIRQQGNSLMVQCANSSPEVQNDGDRTSKKDRQAHGYGLKIITEIAGNYGGSLSVERERDSFYADVILYGVTGENRP